MKPKLFDRILLALLLIVTLALSVGCILLALPVVPPANTKATVDFIYSDPMWQWILGGAGAVLLIITLRLMFAGPKKKAPEPMPTSTLVHTTDLGSAYITISAIDAMVQKHCRANNRVRTVQSTVIPVRDGAVNVRLRLGLMPDTDIPALSEQLQKSLKEYVERLSGITVQEIAILVEDTAVDPKSRVDTALR